MRFSRRLAGLPEYLATATARRIAEARAAGIDVISLGVGDPDMTPPPELAEVLGREAAAPDAHHYPTNRGQRELREAFAGYYARRFGVVLDPEREVMPLLGAKEGIGHLCQAQLDAGDVALVADPGYPVYRGGPAIAGAEPVALPLRRERGFLPDLAAVSDDDARRANLLLCGYPNNPTGAVAELGFLQELARFGLERNVPIAHDNAYAELTYDGFKAPSFLAAPDGVEAGIEIYSLSKALNMPGWRIAFAVGNAGMLQNLTRLKTNIDSGMFVGMQRTAVAAIDLLPAFTAGMREVYERRRNLVCDALARFGVEIERPRGSIYVWAPTPAGVASDAFAARLLAEVGVVVGSGAAYGEHGDGYVRLSLTVPDDRLGEAMERMGRLYT
ncbi:MAG TPA: aminotransferase class I/II-fold pyridoxal phosphate-dependent enzyme [Gaiellales bacterium]|jgi:LL-diaminopimelate aminotransferase